MIRWSIDTPSNLELHIAITPFLNPSNFFNQIFNACGLSNSKYSLVFTYTWAMFHFNRVTSDPISEDESAKHHGRIRKFSHFPGNWAMHVFIPCKSL